MADYFYICYSNQEVQKSAVELEEFQKDPTKLQQVDFKDAPIKIDWERFDCKAYPEKLELLTRERKQVDNQSVFYFTNYKEDLIYTSDCKELDFDLQNLLFNDCGLQICKPPSSELPAERMIKLNVRWIFPNIST